MKNNTLRWLRRMVALLLCLCLACAGLSGIAFAVETPPEETLEEGPTEPMEEPVIEPEYQVLVEDISGYYNEPVDLTIRMEDVGGTGWQKVEASLSPDDPEQRTDLTEALLNGMASYTVSDNCTVYFFITDMEGTEHAETYFVSCFDFDSPKAQAGIRGGLLRVEATDALSGVRGIYVNDCLYTTLEDGVLELWIENCTDEPLFYIQAVDRLGNESGYVVLSNPFYEEPFEETPEEKPVEEPEKGCPKDCDCRSQKAETTPTQPAASSASSTGTSSTKNPSAAQSGTTASDKTDAPVTTEPGEGFSENGSAVTRDLLYDKYTNKQFITVETRNGETFYLVIDYDKPTDEEGEQYETYFLNLVDEADLAALLGDGPELVCTCTEKCQPGAVNTSCKICRNELYDCAGPETVTKEPETPDPEPEPEPDPESQEPEQEKKTNLILPVMLLLAAAGGGAVWYFKFRKNKPDTRGPVDLDDYDYGEDDDTDYEPEAETEDESMENE